MAQPFLHCPHQTSSVGRVDGVSVILKSLLYQSVDAMHAVNAAKFDSIDPL